MARGDGTAKWPVFGLIRLAFGSVGEHFGQLVVAILPAIVLVICVGLMQLYLIRALVGFGLASISLFQLITLLSLAVVGLSVVWGMITWHRAIILGERGFRGFGMRDLHYALILILMILPVFVLFFALGLLTTTLAPLIADLFGARPGSPRLDGGAVAFIGLGLVTLFITNMTALAIYVFWGLILPHIAVRETPIKRLWSANATIAPQFWPVFWAIFLFVLLQFAVGLVLQFAGAAAIYGLGLPPLLFIAVNYLAYLVLIVIATGVLSHAYLLLAPEENGLGP